LVPKLDHERTTRLEISNQVVLWGEERDFEVPISLGNNHPFALANTQIPQELRPKTWLPKEHGKFKYSTKSPQGKRDLKVPTKVPQ
jgi:hypothetical protein